MFDCTCNTQNSLLLNQHNGDDAPQVLSLLGVPESGTGISPAAGYGNVAVTQHQSQWPYGLRRRSAAACSLGSWVRIPPGA